MAVEPMLIECKATNTIEAIQALAPGRIVACDFYISGIEKFADVTGGYEKGRLLSVDHHAPTDRMMRHVSSANLAIELVKSGWQLGDATVVINHTDCDSVLSAGIVSGILDPLPEYGEAAISADHTGAFNEIAVLLQGRENVRDFPGAIADLQALENGKPLSAHGVQGLERRARKRGLAADMIEIGRLERRGRIAFEVF